MVHILAFGALLALAIEGTFAIEPLYGILDPPMYREKINVVQKATSVLDNLLDSTNLSVLDPVLHYLALVGVVESAARDVNPCILLPVTVTTDLVLNKLKTELPLVLLDQTTTVEEVGEVLNDTLTNLEPLTDVVESVCDDVSDNECDKLVDQLLRQRKELQEAVRYLNPAYNVAYGLVSKDKRLLEVTDNLDVVPYVVANLKDVADYTEAVADLLNLLYPFKC